MVEKKAVLVRRRLLRASPCSIQRGTELKAEAAAHRRAARTAARADDGGAVPPPPLRPPLPHPPAPTIVARFATARTLTDS
eukprot:3854543-Pyramimonas_sp.AAC.1